MRIRNFQCSSIHNIFGCVETHGGVMVDCYAQNGTDVFSLTQLFILVVLCYDLCTDQSNGLRRWFRNQEG